MSPMTAIIVLIGGGFLLLWGVQSALLVMNGESLAPPLRYRSEKPGIVYPMKVMVQLSWLLIIVGYPLLIGSGPLEFYAHAFRAPAPGRAMAIMVVACISGFALIYAIYIATGAVELAMLHSPRKTVRRVVGCFLTPIPLAVMEEAVFRGALLNALLSWLNGPAGTTAAVIISSGLFSSVHFIRRRDTSRKPMLQPAIGLFFVGVVLGTAYVAGGNTLWLPVATHAAGILAVELPRSFVIYKAQPKWIGYRSFPHSGPLGILHMIGLTLLVWYLMR